MKKMIMSAAVAIMAASMSVPAFAHQVTIVGGTNGAPAAETPGSSEGHSFSDVSDADKDIIDIAVKNGAIVGVTDNMLGAEDNLSLQDLCVILWNMAGCPDAYGKIAYNANKADKYAVAAIKWAVSQNIISGTDDPHKLLTAADVKQMLDKAGYDIAAVEGSENDVTKIEALRMIVKADKRDTIDKVGYGVPEEHQKA